MFVKKQEMRSTANVITFPSVTKTVRKTHASNSYSCLVGDDITTMRGVVKAQELLIDDLIFTRDYGYQKVVCHFWDENGFVEFGLRYNTAVLLNSEWINANKSEENSVTLA